MRLPFWPLKQTPPHFFPAALMGMSQATGLPTDFRRPSTASLLHMSVGGWPTDDCLLSPGLEPPRGEAQPGSGVVAAA